MHMHLCHFYFPQRGFFSLPEGHYFIEPVQKSPDDPAGTPEPHVVYPRVTTESHRKKRNAESKETPSPCGVQGVYPNVCVCVRVCMVLQMFVQSYRCEYFSVSSKDKSQVYCE